MCSTAAPYVSGETAKALGRVLLSPRGCGCPYGDVEKSALVKAFYDFLGCGDFQSFSITVMVLLTVTFGVKNLFLFLQQKLTFAFVYTNQFRTSERMMRNYLRRGYEFYLNADTAVVQRSITSDVMWGWGTWSGQLVESILVFYAVPGMALRSSSLCGKLSYL